MPLREREDPRDSVVPVRAGVTPGVTPGLTPSVTAGTCDDDAPVPCFTLGTAVTLSTLVQTIDPATGTAAPADDPGLKLYLLSPRGEETIWTVAPGQVVHYGTGKYYAVYLAEEVGVWTFRWVGDVTAEGASEGKFEIKSIYEKLTQPPDLTNTRVMVARARRYIEGPYGPPENRPPLHDDVINAMVADACADIILFSGSLFGHRLLVAAREPTAGYPTDWKTGDVLDEWEVAVVTSQAALNYFFFVFRELKSSQAIKNEGTEWQYTLSVNVIRDYLRELQGRRDMALAGLQKHHPVLDRYASNIRVRDQATVAILEWWDNVSPASGGGGMPGGQEAGVIPWTPGWSGPGFTP